MRLWSVWGGYGLIRGNPDVFVYHSAIVVGDDYPWLAPDEEVEYEDREAPPDDQGISDWPRTGPAFTVSVR